jgi:hypothetical protein
MTAAREAGHLQIHLRIDRFIALLSGPLALASHGPPTAAKSTIGQRTEDRQGGSQWRHDGAKREEGVLNPNASPTERKNG